MDLNIIDDDVLQIKRTHEKHELFILVMQNKCTAADRLKIMALNQTHRVTLKKCSVVREF